MLTVDGIVYNVDVVSVKRKADFLDRFAKRTDDGVLHRQLIGAYINYQLKLGPNSDPDSYDALWAKLIEKEEYHMVEVPYGSGEIYRFQAYFSNVGDELLCQSKARNLWNNLTVNFTSRKPART